MDNRQATNHSGQQDGGVYVHVREKLNVCVCLCKLVCVPWYLTSQLAHSAGPRRTNCLAWLALRGSAVHGEKDRAETQGTGL